MVLLFLKIHCNGRNIFCIKVKLPVHIKRKFEMTLVGIPVYTIHISMNTECKNTPIEMHNVHKIEIK